jgi:hypothetical protein
LPALIELTFGKPETIDGSDIWAVAVPVAPTHIITAHTALSIVTILSDEGLRFEGRRVYPDESRSG